MFIQTLHLMSRTLPAVPLETKTDDSQTIVRRAPKFIQKVPILEHKSMNPYDVKRFSTVRDPIATHCTNVNERSDAPIFRNLR